MVGNNLSDMQFGRSAGMYTIHVRTTHADIQLPNDLIDASFLDLYDFASALQPAKENSKY